jgi:uncharacterized protein YndB with AHSA1/START domain
MGTSTINVDKQKLVISFERVIDAPVDRVWAAHADPEQIPKWWGPRRYSTTVDKMDFREGGEWRYLNEDDNGGKFAFRGVYKEIVEHDHITWTFEFEQFAGHIVTETISFEDLGGKTRLKVESYYPSIEDLEGAMQSGMLDGANETWDRLEELVEVQ